MTAGLSPDGAGERNLRRNETGAAPRRTGLRPPGEWVAFAEQVPLDLHGSIDRMRGLEGVTVQFGGQVVRRRPIRLRFPQAE
jgi:hypothetical protein